MMDQIQTRSYFKEHPVTASQSPAHSITSECSQVPGRKVAIKALYPVRQTIQSRIAIPKARKVRTSAKKSRSGCQTCRARHKKCDESRPGCNRCKQQGWICDFLQTNEPSATNSLLKPPSHSVALKTPAPRPSLSPSPVKWNHQEAQVFHHIHHSLLNDPDDILLGNVGLRNLLLQMCHSEPCIRHICIGTSMIWQIYEEIISKPGDRSQLPIYRSAFRHYQKSIQFLKDRLETIKGNPDITSWEVALVANLMFIAFEVIVANEEGAYWHMQSGFKLLKGVMEKYEKGRPLPGSLDELTVGFNRIDIQTSIFTSSFYETQALLPPTVPLMFLSISHAHAILESVIPHILSLLRSWRPEKYGDRHPSDALPGPIASRLEELKAILQAWLHTLEKFVIGNGLNKCILRGYPHDPPTIPYKIAYQKVMIQYHTAYIWLHTPFCRYQTVHDPFLTAFKTIVTLAEDVLRTQPGQFNFTGKTNLIYSLFYCAQKCRDGHLRRHAVQLLRIAGREGLWDGLATSAVADWIVMKEEEGLREGEIGSIDPTDANFVEERYRLKGAAIQLNRFGKTLKISCSRNREDGGHEAVEGDVRWGEVEEIAYGEMGKLEQQAEFFS